MLKGRDCPILGICYGLQVLALELGGEVEASANREFGYARLKIVERNSPLLKDLPTEMDVWMSHGDHVTSVPAGFTVTALTDDAINAIENKSNSIFGVQFHPEVAHTPMGAQVLRNFLFSDLWLSRRLVHRRLSSPNRVARIQEHLGIIRAWFPAFRAAWIRRLLLPWFIVP